MLPLNRVHLVYAVIKNVKNRNKLPSSCREQTKGGINILRKCHVIVSVLYTYL